MKTSSNSTTFCLIAVILMISFNCADSLPNPQQNRPQPSGFTGAFGQLFNGAVDATGAAGGAVANGASTGFQAFGNTAQDLFNGVIGGYNSASGGLVNGFQSLIGRPANSQAPAQ